MSTVMQPPPMVAELAEPVAQSTSPAALGAATTEQLVQRIYEFAASQMRAGMKARQIEQQLVEQGLDGDTARTVVRNLFQARSKVIRQAGVKNMIAGILWCVGGVTVTALTYQLASDGGGHYIIAFGAVIGGAIQFLRRVRPDGHRLIGLHDVRAAVKIGE